MLNDLELTLIFMLDFDVQVQPEEFNLYRDSLRRGECVLSTANPLSFGCVPARACGLPRQTVFAIVADICS